MLRSELLRKVALNSIGKSAAIRVIYPDIVSDIAIDGKNERQTKKLRSTE